ncbi:MAG: hypothetical protein CR997_07930 [Acidobacteria bacterium]|nr:MAG: hypothetical protein CR997_07930 [Acidobacteriota bacterium]
MLGNKNKLSLAFLFILIAGASSLLVAGNDKPVEVDKDSKEQYVKGVGLIEAIDSELALAVKQYWISYIEEDFITCYQMLCELYRKNIPIKEYLQAETLKIQKVEIKKATKENDNGFNIKVHVHAQHGMFVFNQMPLKQNWIKEGEKWVLFKEHKIDKKGLPF